jgi:DNA-binding response OmpR family regulator
MSGSAYFHVLTEDTRILAVDDDPIMREFAGVYLSSPHASVQTAPDGRAALECVASGSYDILLLDLDMPGLTGFDVLQRLREAPQTADLPIIVVTGREDIASIDRAFNLGATSFVSKPVNWRILAYQVRYVLRASRQGRVSTSPGKRTAAA